MAQAPKLAVSNLFISDLREFVLPTFWCSHIEGQSLTDAIAARNYARVIQFYEEQVGAARKAFLYSDQTHVRNRRLHECYRATDSHVMVQSWSRLISDIAHVAAHIRDSMKDLGRARDHVSRTIRRRLASQIVLAMRLMLLARLCKERTNNNLIAIRLAKEAMPSERATLPRAQAMRNMLANAIANYDHQLHAWHVSRALPAGWKDSGDSYAFDQWSQWFRAAVPGEEGWSGFPRLISRELLFLRSRSGLRQRWAELPLNFSGLWEGKWWARLPLLPIRMLRSAAGFLAQLALIAALWLFMLTCGFGFKPRRVAISVLCVPFLFTSAYTLDDATSQCASITPRLAENSLYTAVATFTNQSGAPHPCGPFTGALASFESITGYFLLSILAAMFFVWLTDR